MTKNETLRQLLATVPLFTDLDDEILAAIEKISNRRTLSKGSLLFAEGDIAESMYVLIEGRLRCFSSADTGKEFVFYVATAGTSFGEMALIDEEPRSLSIDAAEDCQLLSISKTSFLELLEKTPLLNNNLLRNMIRYNRYLANMVKSLALKDVYGRMRLLLENLAIDVNGRRYIEDALSQQAIADRVGSSREMIAKLMRELVFGNYIRIENRRIELLQKLPEHF
ncbi:Crp/Fnr family transcriptional regulator [Iodobacter sp. HSC-16F04]|uniref:Crp/Fnr family transcriptional regulator n=1 Tax=Iodobacter violaceini TaxID=3044271 RepID=A0ABX0KVC3_9NEIS|nr:Crp/Fnr family transcriptional regulator [Iodobacter violacea]NHQ86407.1 Crp/Fnr family transcriptional regulator [Iodobacter violacea]